MKYGFILWGVAMASLGTGNAQNSSLYFNKVYEGKLGKPVQVIPAWNEFSVNGEGAKLSQNEEGDLCAKISANTVFGYMLPLSSVGVETSPYAVECGLQTPKAGAGVDLDLRTPEGEQVSFTLQKQYLIDRMQRDTICRNMDNSRLAAFRFVFDEDRQTRIYKDGVLLSSVLRSRKDLIADPGFEKSSAVDPVWWCSSWSQLAVDGNSPHTGTKSLHWENGWTGQLGARIPVQPNSKYRLSYWAKAVRVNASQSVMKGVLRVGGINKAVLDIPVGDYQKFTVEFTTGNNEEAVDMEFHNGWGNSDSGAFAVYLDDMELTRLEGEAYIQFGKMESSGESDFMLRYVAVKPDEKAAPVQFPDLASAIVQAKALQEGATVGSEIGDFPQYAVDRLQTELVKAEALTAESGYGAIDVACARLQREVSRFNHCRVTEPTLDFSVFEINQLEEKLRVMSKVQLVPSGTMSDGQLIDGELLYVTYASENHHVSVDESGLLTALQVGSDILVVTAQYKNASKMWRLPVEVAPYEIQSIEAVPYEDVLHLGDATGIDVSVLMTGGEAAQENEVSLQYESLTPAVAEINVEGTVIAKASGVAKLKVTANFMEQTMSTQFDLPVITLDRVELELPAELKVGSAGEYRVTAYYTDGTQVQPGQEDIVVYSDYRKVARVDDRGNIMLDSEGEALITVRAKQSTVKKTHAVAVTVESPLLIPTHSRAECTVYPNPAKDKLCVTIGEEWQCTSVAIVSMGGEVVLTRNLSATATNLDISSLAPGTYLVLLKGKQATCYRKLIVQ